MHFLFCSFQSGHIFEGNFACVVFVGHLCFCLTNTEYTAHASACAARYAACHPYKEQHHQQDGEHIGEYQIQIVPCLFIVHVYRRQLRLFAVLIHAV